METQKTDSRERRKKAGFIFLSIGITSVLCVIFFFLFGSRVLLNENREFEPQFEAAQQQQKTQAANANDSITIPGFESMKIPAGKTTVPANIYNPKGNKCYFEAVIILADTNEEIYKSKYISPDQKLYNIELKRALTKGKYKAVLKYNTYALSDYTPLNGANVPFELVVE